jgi:hypothetical protein
VAHHPISHAETAGLPKQDPAKVFHEIFFLAFHDEEAIRDETAEDESQLLAAIVRGLREFTLELLERERLEVVELLENVYDGWRSVGVDPEFLSLVFSQIVSGFLPGDR